MLLKPRPLHLVLKYYCWQTASIVTRSVFDAHSIGSSLVAVVLLCKTFQRMNMMMNSPIFNNYNNSTAADANINNEIQIPQWMIEMHYMRKRLFLRVVEPIIVLLLGPITTDNNDDYYEQNQQQYNAPWQPSVGQQEVRGGGDDSCSLCR